ncbi:MAG: ClpXP protease specificity-enhancing factor SspB, partial [Alphaproteobacteria bacterium]|nr:ClpXP protease specificity-enhancing factor SspB [Alphaproteobacteria bacterium]
QLTFDGRPFFIRVPFTALVEFKDPSVDFMLSFQPKSQPASADNDMELPLEERPDTVPDPGRIVSLDEFRKNRK